jgi:uridylate kinase
MDPAPTHWNRVLLKLGGEMFGGGQVGVDPDVVQDVARQLADVVRTGVQVAVVIGGTVMNCLALQDFLEKQGVETRVQTAIAMGQVAEPYIPRRAIRHLEKGRVVIFGAGLGAPYFSTDTCGAQRALEIGAEVFLMAKGVDGVYDDDPKTNPQAQRFDKIAYAEVLARGLKVADSTAFTMCKDNNLPIVVFNLLVDGNIARAVRGESIGTLVSSGA